MESDPPPDLAIDADVTSETTLDTYAILQVPEVWLYENGKLATHLLENSGYQLSAHSAVFPTLPIAELIPQLVTEAFTTGTSTMLRNLRR
ncbi:MAG: hypothetical protein WBB18_16910 [Nodosilinea sp.]